MLEMASGVFTGSIYYDMGLYSIGECKILPTALRHGPTTWDMGLYSIGECRILLWPERPDPYINDETFLETLNGPAWAPQERK